MNQTERSPEEPGEGPLSAARLVEQLAGDYGRLVFHVILGMIGDWHDSQDLTQEVFLHALVGIDRACAASGPCFQARAWLLSIAVNQVRMYRRRARRYRFVPLAVVESGQDTDTEASGDPLRARPAPVQPPGYAPLVEANPAEVVAERDAVARTLAQLPATLRLPLLLSIVAGCSHAEIARILDLQEATVRQRISRARKTFQALYAQISDEEIRVDTQDQSHPNPQPGQAAARPRRAGPIRGSA